jgi:hypothetical protein
MHSARCRLAPFASCVLATALLVSTLASASGVSPLDATPEQKKEAMDHFMAGKHAFESKDWAKAVAELRASLAVVESPNARLELARALRDSDQRSDAWAEYGRAIENATELAAKEERYAKTADAATSEREELGAKLAFVTVSVAHAPAGASLKVGGRPFPQSQWSSPIVTAPGAVDVVLVDADDKELARKTVSVAVGEDAPVALDPTAAPSGPVLKGKDDSDDEEKSDTSERSRRAADVAPPSSPTKLRPYAYVAGGIGVAGIATFAVFGLMSNSAFSDLQSACHPGCPPDKRSEVDQGRMQQTVANIGLAAGLVGLAAGATFWFLSVPPDAPSGGAALVITPAYVGLRGSL